MHTTTADAPHDSSGPHDVGAPLRTVATVIADSTAVLSTPSDLVAHLSCEHRTWRNHVALLEGTRPPKASEDAAVIAARGDEHEADVLAQLEAQHGPALELAVPPRGVEHLLAADRATEAAMASGVPLIYQPTFYDPVTATTGRADFLVRVESPSGRWDWGYEVIDAKLARRTTTSATVQAYEYSRHVARLQGSAPAQLHIASPSGTATVIVDDVAAYAERARTRFERFVASLPDEPTAVEPDQVPYPVPIDACASCPWAVVCSARRHSDGHLSIVANIRTNDIERLNRHGVTTIEELATHHAEPGTTNARLAQQASLQLAAQDGTPSYVAIDAGPGRGLAALPEPAPGDVFFDFEGDPLVAPHGLEYLVGAVWCDDTGAERFETFWAHSPAEESALTEALLGWLTGHLGRHPGAHAFHYAPYEVAALRRLTARHGHSEDLLDALIERGLLVDLYATVRAGIVAGVESYSIKYLEPLYGLERSADVKTSVGSIVAYEKYLRADPADAQKLLDEIEAYNLDDCRSTLLLRNWLDTVRAEAGIHRGGEEIAEERDPDAPTDDELREQRIARRQRQRDLASTLAASGDPANAVLATLVGWHELESSTGWRDYFERLRADDSTLHSSGEALAGLTVIETTDDHWVLSYDEQDHKLRRGPASWRDPVTGKAPGKVLDVSRRNRRVTIARTEGTEPPGALIAPPPISTDSVAERLRTYADDRASGNPLRNDAVAAVLARTPEPALRASTSTDPLERLRTAALALDGGYLAVQGPPGTGKTYLGARVIAELLAAGNTVGVCGPNHRAIDNLFTEVCAVSADRCVAVNAVRRHSKDHAHSYDHLNSPSVRITVAGSNGPVGTALRGANRALGRGVVANLLAGTPWLYCSSAITDAGTEVLDYLVVDEAGQFPLAELVAAGSVARNIILLGDPRQLPQVEVAAHGEHQAVSALGHITADADVIDPTRGVFLAETRRMSAPLCATVSHLSYNDELRSHPECADRHLIHPLGARIDGVIHLDAHHTGCATSSAEEVEVVAELVANLLECEFVDGDTRREMTAADIVVIAPFNAHVERLTERLVTLDPALQDCVGTVDRFQGREAAVSIYALGTSGGDAMSRGADFVFSTQRLNVALSRGMAAAYVVCAPALLDHVATSHDELRAVSKFLDALS